ncbi:hypothetical protein, partial [Candidatus Synechococcus spongiarum]|uniref:hypothetical protein n=1 Tax=Candidatus Synechococcus spongiarum TaxID=431041 RepID=UPI000557CA76
ETLDRLLEDRFSKLSRPPTLARLLMEPLRQRHPLRRCGMIPRNTRRRFTVQGDTPQRPC